jgi:hypothetical protein
MAASWCGVGAAAKAVDQLARRAAGLYLENVFGLARSERDIFGQYDEQKLEHNGEVKPRRMVCSVNLRHEAAKYAAAHRH